MYRYVRRFNEIAFLHRNFLVCHLSRLRGYNIYTLRLVKNDGGIVLTRVI